MLTSLSFVLQRLFALIICASFANIVDADMFLQMPTIIDLPIDYVESQTENLKLHPFKIKFQQMLIVEQDLFSSEPIDRLYYITSFFYSLLIKVQHIPQNQTKFPNTTCFGYQVPSIYYQNGFSTNDQDIIIFTRQKKQQPYYQNMIPGAGACVVERRPLYGQFIFYHRHFRVYADNANFHNILVKMIHSTLHILGLNTNFLVQPSQTYFRLLIENYIDNQTTTFFKNSKSSKRLLIKEVMLVGNSLWPPWPTIITPTVKKAIKQIFECSQTDLVYGAVLDTQLSVTNQQYFRFHWHPKIFQDQFMINNQNDQNSVKKDNQQRRMSKLSWAMLQDTGFYQHIQHSLSDNFEYRTFQSGSMKPGQTIFQEIKSKKKCQMHKELYSWDTQNAFKYIFHCNVYGTSRRNTDYDPKTGIAFTNFQTFKQNKCTKMSPNFRCFEILYKPANAVQYQSYQECTYAECIDKNTIRILFGGNWQIGCTREQAGMNKRFNFRTNFTIHCPSNFDAFCNKQACENWCNKQGICINGQCYYPQNRFESQLKINNLQYGFYPTYLDATTNQNITGKVCQRGCLDCYSNEVEPLKICKVNKIHNDDQNPTFPICPQGFKTCLRLTQVVVPCFENYFLQNSRCYRCDSSCTHCQQTYGSIQMINFCKNCLEGSFPFKQICQSCQVENCMYCKEKGKCQKCKLNYYVTANWTKCIRCLSNCGICDPKNISLCLGCGQGFFLDVNNNQCKKCIDFCRKCSNDSICLQCHKGFIQRQSICVRPCELPCHQCFIGQPSKCLSCVSYHDYDPTSYSCDKTNQNKSNVNCPLGYLKAAENQLQINFKCQPIRIANCLIAIQSWELNVDLFQKSEYCNLCKKGFFVNQINQCSLCPQGCSYCFQADVCDVCDDGFSNPKNRDGSRNTAKCQKCTQNCLQCPSSPEQCQLCTKNYELIGVLCHSVNRVYAQFTFDVDYQLFVSSNKFQAIKNMILSLIDKKSQVQIIRVTSGSIKVFAVVSRTFQGQITKDCLLSYNLTSKFNNATAGAEFALIGASFTNNLPECDNFNPQSLEIVYYISVGAAILVISLIIIIVYLIKKLTTTEKLILKLEEIQSRPQYYLQQSQYKIGF